MARTIPILTTAVAFAMAMAAYKPATAQQAQDDYQQDDYQQSDTPALQQEQQEQQTGQDEPRRQEAGLPEAQSRDREQEDDRQQFERGQQEPARQDRPTRPSRQEEFNFGARLTQSENTLSVGTVNQGTMAAEIGLQADDEIIAVGNRAVFTEDDLNQALRQSSTTQARIPIVVRRDSGRTTLFIEPQRLRTAFGSDSGFGDTDLGLTWSTDANDQLIVRDVTGGLATRLGLRARDVLLSVGGRRIASPTQFERWIYDVDFVDGRRVPVVVMRDGRRVTLYLEPKMVQYRFRDRDFSEDPDFYRGQEAWLGVTLNPNYEDYAVVQSVVRNSPAEQAGIRRGDWIVRLNGRRVNSPSHVTSLVQSMDPGDELEIEISRRVARTLVARLDADRSSEARQALRPTFDTFEERDGFIPDGRRFIRPDMTDEFDPDLDRRGLRDRVGPGERGLRDRLDPDEIPDEPRGILPR